MALIFMFVADYLQSIRVRFANAMNNKKRVPLSPPLLTFSTIDQ